MERIYNLLYLLNKIDFYTYLECNDDERYNYIRTIKIDEFENSNSVKIKNMLNVVDGFVNFSDNNNNELSGYW